MQANIQLNESLQRLVDRFGVLTAAHFQELRPIGESSTRIGAVAANDRESFLRHLKDLSAAVIRVRKESSGSPPLRDLPVPSYDLFLPFRSDAIAGNDAPALADAIGCFNEKVKQLASYWTPYAGASILENQPTTNPDLLSLRGRIMKQFEKCNDLRQFDLFKPTLKSYTDLFERKILITANSADDFRGFVTVLHQVFWEGLPNEVRKWEAGQSLPLELPQPTMALLKGDAFRKLNKLRNKWNHDDPDWRKELAPIYQGYVGVPVIARDDSKRWLALQIAVLESLASTLEEVSKSMEHSRPNDES